LKANWLTATPSVHATVVAALAALGASIAASGTTTIAVAANRSLRNMSLSPHGRLVPGRPSRGRGRPGRHRVLASLCKPEAGRHKDQYRH
jgi:hypothetical protein